MAKFALGPSQGASGFNVSKQFYSASGSSAGLSFSGSEATGIPGEITPEEAVQLRPFAGTGKVSINLLGASPKATPPVAKPQMKGADVLKASELPVISWGPIPDILGAGTDFLASAPPVPLFPGLEMVQGMAAKEGREKEKLSTAELSAISPDLPGKVAALKRQQQENMISEGQYHAAFLRTVMQAEAHKQGQSSLLLEQALVPPANAGEQLIQLLTLVTGGLQQTVARTLFSNRFDEVMNWTGEKTTREVRDPRTGKMVTVTEEPEQLGPELLDIRERYLSGELNEHEARDLIARSADNVMASRDTPFDVAGHDIGRFVPWLLSQVVTDPISLGTIVLSGGSSLGLRGANTAVRGTTQLLAKEAIAAARSASKKVIAEGDLEVIGRQATERWVTAVMDSAKAAGENTAKWTSRDMNTHLVKWALRDPQLAVPLTKGMQEMGLVSRTLASQEHVVAVAAKVANMLDPLTLFGYGAAGGLVNLRTATTMSRGYIKALGEEAFGSIDRSVAKFIGNDAYRIGIEADGVSTGNLSRQVGHQQNIAYGVYQQATEVEQVAQLADDAISKAGSNSERLLFDYTQQKAERLVPRRGETAEQALGRWRERAVQHFMNIYGESGLTEAQARQLASVANENELRVLQFRNWAVRVVRLEQAKKRALATAPAAISARTKAAKALKAANKAGDKALIAQAKADFDAAVALSEELIDRVTLLGPGQLTRDAVRQLRKALKSGDMATVRGMVSQYDDLSFNLSLGVEDATLAGQVEVLLRKLQDANLIPEAIPRKSLPKELQEFIDRYGDEGVALKPRDSDIATPILDDAGNVIGTSAWLDITTEASAVAYKGRLDRILGKLFMNVSGTQVERSANHRLEKLAGEKWGWSAEQTKGVVTALRKAAETGGINATPVTIRGLSPEQMYQAALSTKLPHELTNLPNFNERSFAETVVEAWEGDFWTVGLTQKFTGKSKTLTAAGGNWIGRMAENLYPLVRFRYSPFFQMQELFEAPFFMTMRGEFPLRDALSGTYLRVSGALPGRVGKRMPGLQRAAERQERSRLLTEETLALMERRDQFDGMYKGDMVERSDYVRLSSRAANDVAGVQSPVGRLAAKVADAFPVAQRKQRYEALHYRNRLGEEWKRAMLKHSPGTWYGLRSVTPDNISDGQMAINWLTDLHARLDPDSVLSRLGPEAMRPSHIGSRTRVSPVLLRHIVYGDDWAAPKSTLTNIRKRIADPKDSLDVEYVLDGLRNLGASEDYILRSKVALTFPGVDEYYDQMVAKGISKAEVVNWRKHDEYNARQSGIPLQEYLGRGWGGAPQGIDQFGNLTGETLWQKAVTAMEARGKVVVGRDDPLLDEMRLAGVAMLPERNLEDITRVAEGQMRVKDLGGGEAKVREYAIARERYEADPERYMPPAQTIGEQTVDGEVRVTLGRVSPQQVAESIAATMSSGEIQEALDWYLDMRRVILSLNDNDPQKAAEYIIGFGLTQLNTSPETGMQYLLRMREAIWRGDDLPLLDETAMKQLGGLNAEAIARHFTSGMTDDGTAQKLMDFIDSLLGREVRSSGGPGSPVAADIWMKRVTGYVDNQTAYRMAGMYGHKQSGLVERVEGVAPIAPGTAPLAPGMVRAYHYTRGEGSLESIRQNGLLQSRAIGETYGEPNQLWFSTQKPDNSKSYVEVHLDPREINGTGGPSLHILRGTPTDEEVARWADETNRRGSNFAIRTGDIAPDRIVTYSEPWMPEYWGLRADGPSDPVAFREQFGWALEGKWATRPTGVAVAKRLGELEGTIRPLATVRRSRGRSFQIEVGPEVRAGSALSDRGDGTYLHVPEEYISNGQPTNEQYAYIVEWTQELTDLLNASGKFDRTLTPPEVQALAWTYIRKVQGEPAGDPYAVFFGKTESFNTEIRPGAGSPYEAIYPWADENGEAILGPEATRELTDRIIPSMSALAEELVGVQVIGHAGGNGSWMGTLSPNMTSELSASRHGAQAYVATLGFLTQQTQTLGSMLRRFHVPGKTRWAKSQFPSMDAGTSWSVEVVGATPMTHSQALELHQALVDADAPAIAFASGLVRYEDGSWGIRSQWLPWNDATNSYDRGVKTLDDFKAETTDEQLVQIATIAREHGIELYNGSAQRATVDFVSSENDWTDEAMRHGEGHLDVVRRLLGDAKADELAGPYAERAAALIEDAHQSLVPAETAAYRAQQAARNGHTLDADNPGADFAVRRERSGGGLGLPEPWREGPYAEFTERVSVDELTKYMEIDREVTPKYRGDYAWLDELEADIRANGIRDPLILQYDPQGRLVLLGEGNHRLAVGKRMGMTDLPARVSRTSDMSMEPKAVGVPGKDPDEFGYVPGDMKPSDIGIPVVRDVDDVQYQQAPAGTRAAIVRQASDNRSQLYLNRPLVRRDTLLHEMAHQFAWERLDPSAIRRIKGLYAGRPGAPPGGRVSRAQKLTADEQEWFVGQFINYVRTGKAPANGLIPFFEFYKAHLKGMRAHASGPVHPDVEKLLGEAFQKRPYRGYGYDVDEVNALQWMMAGDQRARRHSRDLIHFKGERTWLERSINHPFFGFYPASYMWGKVLPEMAEFLLFRPFGLRTPMLGLNTVNRMYQSFMTQQEYDPELRQFLLDNEPALRALSMMTPGLPWELPANLPLWFRRWAEHVQENAVRQANGEEPVDFDWGRVIADTASYQIGPVRSITSVPQTIAGAMALPGIAGQIASGEMETDAERKMREREEQRKALERENLDPLQQLSETLNDVVMNLTGGLTGASQQEDRP